MELKLLMKLARECGISQLQVYEDLEVIINCMEVSYMLGNLLLSPILETFKDGPTLFSNISFLREINSQADDLSKVRLL